MPLWNYYLIKRYIINPFLTFTSTEETVIPELFGFNGFGLSFLQAIAISNTIALNIRL